MLRYEPQQDPDSRCAGTSPDPGQVALPRRRLWRRPRVRRGPDLAAQQRYFEALADVLSQKLDNASILRGWFLWDWPVDGAQAGALDSGFSLRQKPVESALRRLFAR